MCPHWQVDAYRKKRQADCRLELLPRLNRSRDMIIGSSMWTLLLLRIAKMETSLSFDFDRASQASCHGGVAVVCCPAACRMYEFSPGPVERAI